ncbi:MAG: hypothetical protein Kow0037_25250 [Calditrichia bacterium]
MNRLRKIAIPSIAIMIGWFCLAFARTGSGTLIGPGIEVKPTQLNFTSPQFLWSLHPLTIKNTGDQPLDFQITDESLAMREARSFEIYPADQLKPLLLAKIAMLRRAAAASGLPLQPPAVPLAGRDPAQTVITDPAGDVASPGSDITQIGFEETFFTYNITLQFAGTPDTSLLALVSFDTDQNFGTGGYPPPFGYGLGNADVGSEYEVLFDIANLMGDTLGLPPSAFILDARDSIPSLVGLPGLLTFSGNQVTASFLKAGLNIFDSDMNLSALCVSLAPNDLPDFAPDFGHGTYGNELGSSWICQLDSSGNSIYPFTGQVAPGDSARLLVKVAAAFPHGSYMGKPKIQNNSSTPLVEVPVSLTVGLAGQPLIQVTPSAISDTLPAGGAAQNYTLQIANNGTSPLGYVLADTVWTGNNWLEMPLPIGWVEPGAQSQIIFSVNPVGFQPNQTYLGQITVYSTDTLNSPIMVPIQIYAASTTGIANPTQLTERYSLSPNYPNPFNPATRFEVNLPETRVVEIAVYTADGRKLRSIYAGRLPAGRHQFDWDGKDNSGRRVSSGIYLYRLESDGFSFTRKMLLMK